jgi:hypothetical protein
VLNFRTLNDGKSAFCRFQFEESFFDQVRHEASGEDVVQVLDICDESLQYTSRALTLTLAPILIIRTGCSSSSACPRETSAKRSRIYW